MTKCAAEFIGTFALVFAGTRTIIINHARGGVITQVGIALTFGLVVLAMIYMVGDISRAHLTCCQSRFLCSATIPRARFHFHTSLVNVLEHSPQLASCGFCFQKTRSSRNTASRPAMQAFVLELILTAMLMFVILNVSSGSAEKGITPGIAVGAVIGLEAIFAGPISGPSMNPAIRRKGSQI